MSPLFYWMTAGLFTIPPLFLVLGLGTEAWPLAPMGLFVAALYLLIWLRWRPTRFEIAPRSLVLRFPTLRRELPASDIVSVRRLDAARFREEFGLAFRIGAGGLWGGFGWLWTSKSGLVEFYVSRLDGFVLLERRSARPLLVTPEHPDEFVEALSEIF